MEVNIIPTRLFLQVFLWREDVPCHTFQTIDLGSNVCTSGWWISWSDPIILGWTLNLLRLPKDEWQKNAESNAERLRLRNFPV